MATGPCFVLLFFWLGMIGTVSALTRDDSYGTGTGVYQKTQTNRKITELNRQAIESLFALRAEFHPYFMRHMDFQFLRILSKMLGGGEVRSLKTQQEKQDEWLNHELRHDYIAEIPSHMPVSRSKIGFPYETYARKSFTKNHNSLDRSLQSSYKDSHTIPTVILSKQHQSAHRLNAEWHPHRQDARNKDKPIPREFDKDKPIPREFDKHKPIPREFDKDKPIPREFDNHKPIPRESDKHKPIPREFDNYRPIPRKFDNYRPIPREFDKHKPIPREFDNYRPIPREFDNYRPIPREFDKYKPIPRKFDNYRPIPREFDKHKPIPRECEKQKPIPREFDNYRPILREFDKCKPIPRVYDKHKPIPRDLDKYKPIPRELEVAELRRYTQQHFPYSSSVARERQPVSGHFQSRVPEAPIQLHEVPFLRDMTTKPHRPLSDISASERNLHMRKSANTASEAFLPFQLIKNQHPLYRDVLPNAQMSWDKATGDALPRHRNSGPPTRRVPSGGQKEAVIVGSPVVHDHEVTPRPAVQYVLTDGKTIHKIINAYFPQDSNGTAQLPVRYVITKGKKQDLASLNSLPHKVQPVPYTPVRYILTKGQAFSDKVTDDQLPKKPKIGSRPRVHYVLPGNQKPRGRGEGPVPNDTKIKPRPPAQHTMTDQQTFYEVNNTLPDGDNDNPHLPVQHTDRQNLTDPNASLPRNDSVKQLPLGHNILTDSQKSSNEVTHDLNMTVQSPVPYNITGDNDGPEQVTSSPSQHDHTPERPPSGYVITDNKHGTQSSPGTIIPPDRTTSGPLQPPTRLSEQYVGDQNYSSESAQNSGQHYSTESAQNSGQSDSTESGQNSGQSDSTESAQNFAQTYSPESAQNSGQRDSTESAQNSGQTYSAGSAQNSKQSNSTESRRNCSSDLLSDDSSKFILSLSDGLLMAALISALTAAVMTVLSLSLFWVYHRYQSTEHRFGTLSPGSRRVVLDSFATDEEDESM